MAFRECKKEIAYKMGRDICGYSDWNFNFSFLQSLRKEKMNLYPQTIFGEWILLFVALLFALMVVFFIVDLFRPLPLKNKINNFAFTVGTALLLWPTLFRIYEEVWFWITTPGF